MDTATSARRPHCSAHARRVPRCSARYRHAGSRCASIRPSARCLRPAVRCWCRSRAGRNLPIHHVRPAASSATMPSSPHSPLPSAHRAHRAHAWRAAGVSRFEPMRPARTQAHPASGTRRQARKSGAQTYSARSRRTVGLAPVSGAWGKQGALTPRDARGLSAATKVGATNGRCHDVNLVGRRPAVESQSVRPHDGM